MTDWSLSRRRTLQLCSLGLAGAVAGCREAGPAGTDTTVESEPATDATTATTSPTAVLSPAATDSESPQPTATEQVPPGKLIAADGDGDDQFGTAVSLSGDRALVGVESDDNANGTDAGAVYVFERTDGVWSQQAALLDASGGANQHLGDAVALAGDRALASTAESPPPDATHTHTDEETFATGAVVVYRRTDGGWRQARRLTAVDGDPGDHFGDAIAVAEGTALVGAVGDEDPNGDAAGSAYVYELTD